MRRFALLLILVFLCPAGVQATAWTAPPAPESVAAQVPQEADSFAQGLWNVLREALNSLDGAFSEALEHCTALIAVVLLCALVRQLGAGGFALELAGTVAAAATLLDCGTSMLYLGLETAQQISAYGKLLLPVMTGAMAAQGGVTASAALYAGTAFFDSLLNSLLAKLLPPLIWLFLGLSVAHSALGEAMLQSLKDTVQWVAGWALKGVLYLFLGYMTITGAVSGSADAAAVKAAKITISGAVPVVGGILSDATESVLSGIGVLRSGIGIYGLWTVLALFLTPFLRIGLQYLLLKAVSILCIGLEPKGAGQVVGDFSEALAMVLAMVGTQTVLVLMATVCTMKGVG